MKHLYFIRHGQSELNAQGIFAGRLDTPLTDTGRLQAKNAGKDIKNLHIDLIVSSDLGRAIETAQIIAREIGYSQDDIVVNPLFVEQFYGSLEGKPWTETPNIGKYTDIESDEELVERAKEGLAYLRTLPAETVLLVSHGSYSRALRAAIEGGDIKKDEPENAKVVQFI